MTYGIHRLRALLPILVGLHPGSMSAQEAAPPAEAVEGRTFEVFDAKGRPSSFAALLKAMDKVDVVLIGEEHDDMVGHAVELEILVRAVERFSDDAEPDRRRPVILSLEMFERDVQQVLDEYLDDLIAEEHFLAASRPWPSYETRYRPLVEHVKEVRIPLVAANAPRRYVSRVTRLGPESLVSLPESAKAFLPPLPYPGPSEKYRGEWTALMGGFGMGAAPEAAASDTVAESPHARGGDPGEANPMRFALDSQSLWDASMAEAVGRAARGTPGSLVLHMVGVFHVENFTGIPEALKVYEKDLRQLVVVVRPEDEELQPTRDALEGRGDFVILTRSGAEEPGAR